MYLKKLHGSLSLGRDQIPTSIRPSTVPASHLCWIRKQSSRWLKLVKKCLIPNAVCHHPALLLGVLFPYQVAEELLSLLRRAPSPSFGRRAVPQLDLHWPCYQKHPHFLFPILIFPHSRYLPNILPSPQDCIHYGNLKLHFGGCTGAYTYPTDVQSNYCTAMGCPQGGCVSPSAAIRAVVLGALAPSVLLFLVKCC